MNCQPSRTLYVATGRTIIALNPSSGAEHWRTRLRGMGQSIVTLFLKDPHLFAGNRGRVFCLDARNGALLWESGLPGTGHGVVLMTMQGAADSADAISSAASAAAAAAAASAAAAGAAAAG